MQTPAVISATCRYSRAENVLPPRRTPPAITGTILHDLPSTCVGNETKRSASFEPYIARLCVTPLYGMSMYGTLSPEPPKSMMPSRPTSAEMPRSNSSVSSVYGTSPAPRRTAACTRPRGVADEATARRSTASAGGAEEERWERRGAACLLWARADELDAAGAAPASAAWLVTFDATRLVLRPRSRRACRRRRSRRRLTAAASSPRHLGADATRGVRRHALMPRCSPRCHRSPATRSTRRRGATPPRFGGRVVTRLAASDRAMGVLIHQFDDMEDPKAPSSTLTTPR